MSSIGLPSLDEREQPRNDGEASRKLELCVHDNVTQTQNYVISEIQTVCKNINKAKVTLLLKRTTEWRKFMKILRSF